MPEFKTTNDIMIISSVAREKRDSLPPLIRDARENPLVAVHTPEGTVNVRPVAMPYTQHHMLVIPDLATGEDTPSVITTPEVLLEKTFHVAHDIAEYYSQNQNIRQIDVGFNYSRLENKKHIATQQRTLHVHVVGYDNDDIAHRIDKKEARNRPYLKNKMSEPLSRLASELMYRQVLPEVQLRHSNFFAENFLAEEDSKYFTLDMKTGLSVLSQPETTLVLKELHESGQKVYDELGRCFFVYNREKETFTEGEDGRYELLPVEQRTKRIYEYLAHHPDLSFSSRKTLLNLAVSAKTTDEVIRRKEDKKGMELTDEEKEQELTRFMAIKNFAYAAVFSGVRTENGMEWKFGFDPAIFSTRDILQASRGETKLFERNPNVTYDEATLNVIKRDEKALCDALLQKDDEYELGNGYNQLK